MNIDCIDKSSRCVAVDMSRDLTRRIAYSCIILKLQPKGTTKRVSSAFSGHTLAQVRLGTGIFTTARCMFTTAIAQDAATPRLLGMI